ncbi:MAG: hypothetical protein V1758_00115, partial [Pseudomonadota bacterium]
SLASERRRINRTGLSIDSSHELNKADEKGSCRQAGICGIALILRHCGVLLVRLIPQNCLPDRQVKVTTGALHLNLFDQP